MDEVRRRTDAALALLRHTVAAAVQARDAALRAGQEGVAREEEATIAGLEGRIAWLERQAAEFEARQARRMEEEEG